MGLIFTQAAPEDVVAAARKTLAELADVPDARGGASPLARYFVSDVPLAVYSLGLDRLTNGGGLADTKAVAWRVFVLDSHNDPVGVADVAPSGGGEPAHLLGYTRGPQVASSGRALSDAAADSIAQGRYEPRFLEIPGINTTALWLKDLGGDEDRMIPVDPIPRFLRDQETYSPGEFLDRVRPQAIKRLDFDDKPPRDEGGDELPMRGPAGG